MYIYQNIIPHTDMIHGMHVETRTLFVGILIFNVYKTIIEHSYIIQIKECVYQL